MPATDMDQVVNLCKSRGFVYQSAEIYGGFRSTYDYGPLGVQLLRNVKDAWWRSMVQLRDDVVGLDAAILGPSQVWKASGHLDTFTDPLVDCRSCKERWRADLLSRRSVRPNCGSTDLTEARAFNLMFKTHVGPVEDEGSVAYLRPETAQGMFINFKNVIQTHAQEASLRHRPGGQELPQRDHARQLRVPHPRVRADGARVLRAAQRVEAVVRLLGGGAVRLVHRSRHPRGHAPHPAPRDGGAQPLLGGHVRRGVPLPVGMGRARGRRPAHGLRPHRPRQGVGRDTSTGSTRRQGSGTSRTWSSRRRAPRAR